MNDLVSELVDVFGIHTPEFIRCHGGNSHTGRILDMID